MKNSSVENIRRQVKKYFAEEIFTEKVVELNFKLLDIRKGDPKCGNEIHF